MEQQLIYATTERKTSNRNFSTNNTLKNTVQVFEFESFSTFNSIFLEARINSLKINCSLFVLDYICVSESVTFTNIKNHVTLVKIKIFYVASSSII